MSDYQITAIDILAIWWLLLACWRAHQLLSLGDASLFRMMLVLPLLPIEWAMNLVRIYPVCPECDGEGCAFCDEDDEGIQWEDECDCDNCKERKEKEED